MKTLRLLPLLFVALAALALTGCDPAPKDDANATTTGTNAGDGTNGPKPATPSPTTPSTN